MPNPINFRYPFELKDAPAEIQQAHRFAFQGLVDAQQGIASLKQQIDAITSASSSSGTSTTVENVTSTSIENPNYVGSVSNRSGMTAYAVQQSDNGALVVLSDASAIAVSLPAVTVPFYATLSNQGAGTATLTPSAGTIAGGATLTLPGGCFTSIFYDGTNWQATQQQQAFSNITGNLVLSQLPVSGLTITITTAKLTTGGTEGSLVFQNGLLTAQTQAT